MGAHKCCKTVAARRRWRPAGPPLTRAGARRNLQWRARLVGRRNLGQSNVFQWRIELAPRTKCKLASELVSGGAPVLAPGWLLKSRRRQGVRPKLVWVHAGAERGARPLIELAPGRPMGTGLGGASGQLGQLGGALRGAPGLCEPAPLVERLDTLAGGRGRPAGGQTLGGRRRHGLGQPEFGRPADTPTSRPTGRIPGRAQLCRRARIHHRLGGRLAMRPGRARAAEVRLAEMTSASSSGRPSCHVCWRHCLCARACP